MQLFAMEKTELFLKDHAKLGPIYAISYSHDGKLILTNSGIARSCDILGAPTKSAACIWDAKTGILLHLLAHASVIHSTTFSPRDTFVLTTTEDDETSGISTKGADRLRIWDTNSSTLLRTILHAGKLYTAACSPDERHIVTAATIEYRLGTPIGWNVCVWNIRTGDLVRTLKHPHATHSAIYSPDGNYILTTSNDNTVQVWDANTGYVVPFKSEKLD